MWILQIVYLVGETKMNPLSYFCWVLLCFVSKIQAGTLTQSYPVSAQADKDNWVAEINAARGAIGATNMNCVVS